MRSRRWSCVAVALLAAAFPAPLRGAVKPSGESDVKEQLFKLQKDTARLIADQQKLLTQLQAGQGQAACADVASRLDALARAVAALQETARQTQQRLDETTAELRAVRLAQTPPRPAPVRANETTGVPAAAPGQAPGSATEARPAQARSGEARPAGGAGDAPAGNPVDLFRAAYSDYNRQMYPLALSGFQRAAAADPTGPMADDAGYWIGETLLSLGRTDEAIRAFERVIEDFPQSDKLASARYRKGVALFAAQRAAEGTRELQTVISGYPASPEAAAARNFLEEKKLGR